MPCTLLTGIVAQFAHGARCRCSDFVNSITLDAGSRFCASVKEIHEIAANALVIVASFHAAAALIHHFIFHGHTLVACSSRQKLAVSAAVT